MKTPLWKRIRSRIRASADGTKPARDDGAFIASVIARLTACSCRPDLESALAECFRSLFGFRTASLYLPGTSGAYLPVRGNGLEPHFPASSALLFYLLHGKRFWIPAENVYAPDEEEREFARAGDVKCVVPLVRGRQVAGLVVLGPAVPDAALTARDSGIIKAIAGQAGLVLANLALAEELAETRELAVKARTSSFVIHDLKNLAHSLSLMIDNAEEHMANLAFQRDLIASMRQTVKKMNGLSQRLQGIPGPVPHRGQPTDMGLLCRAVIEEFRKTRPGANIVIRGEAVSCLVEGEEIRKVIVNLLQNALDAIGENGLIQVETGMRTGNAFLSIADTGCGMTPDFINGQLFRPFRSTKENGMGIGLYQCRQIVQSMGGSITVTSERGKGSTFRISLPAAERKPVAAG